MHKLAVPELAIKNTMTGKKEKLACTGNANITLYVCGITPYDYAHLGHGRCYMTFDVLVRLLTTSLGCSVRHCRNFTDIDDKLIERSNREFGTPFRYKEVADRYIGAFQEDMDALNCLKPTVEPRVSEEIPDIIEAIKKLVARGFAYEVEGDVYFSVDQFSDYGKLSGRDTHDLVAGARVSVSEKKRNPLDFALWKGEEKGSFWESPWGWGRPGWHIECSVMGYKYLGERIDVHGGGMDLIFPHHENERAQSTALLGVDPVCSWMHIAFVQIDNEKMSKSLGNFFTLRDLFKKYDPMIIRYVVLMHHYRSPIEFSFDVCDMAQASYERVVRAYGQLEPVRPMHWGSESFVGRMMQFLCDDLNTVGMLGVVFDALKGSDCSTQERREIAWILRSICGFTLLLRAQEVELTDEIQRLLAERDVARTSKNWAQADALRERLRVLGYVVQDKKK